MSHKKKKPGKPKLVGQKADLLFFHPTKECLQFLYVTVIEVLQSVKDIDTVGFIPGTGEKFLWRDMEVFTDAQEFVHRGQSLACGNVAHISPMRGVPNGFRIWLSPSITSETAVAALEKPA